MSKEMSELILQGLIMGFVFQLALGFASVCTWLERKASALLQDRIGSNRAGTLFRPKNFVFKPFAWVSWILGIFGLIQTFFCDPVKAFFKEDFVPSGYNKFLHTLAPFVAALPVFLAFAVVPLATEFSVPFYDGVINLQVAKLDAGVLLVLALGSISTIGVMLAGWVSANKFSLLGAIRTAAQLISYELSFGLVLAGMIVLYGTTDLTQMVDAQDGILRWGVFRAPLAFVLLFVVGMAETKRAPFDLPEAESELISGYGTEYSGMKFLLFWLAEFAEIALISLLLSLMFFGGWHCGNISALLGFEEHSWQAALIGHVALLGKVFFFCALQIVIRWTLPRFRFDQLMDLGWKILLPLSLVNLVLMAYQSL